MWSSSTNTGIHRGAVTARQMLSKLAAKQIRGKANKMTIVPRNPFTK